MTHSRSISVPRWLEKSHPLVVLWGYASLLCVLSFIFFSAALAQTEQPVRTGGVDFSPLVSYVLTLAVGALTVVAGIVSKFVTSWLAGKAKVDNATLEQLFADRVHEAIMRGIDYAEAKIKAEVADPNSQIKHVQIDNWFIRQVAEYVMTSVPDTLAYFGLTKESIEDRVRSRLNQIMVTPVTDSGLVPHALNLPAVSRTTPLPSDEVKEE